MKKTITGIGRMILIYAASMIGLNLMSALILAAHCHDSSYFEVFIQLLGNQVHTDEANLISVNLVVALKNLIEGIALAVLASFIFSHILNREIKVIFPDKIVLRRRTSEGTEGKLTIGLLIGNPGKRELLDVKCSINCTYLKKIEDFEQRNGETYLSQSVDSIQHFFRFSFDINSLPKNFWRHYLERNEEYVNKDFLLVAIMGKTDGLGGYFRVTKKYSLQDIIVDFHEPEKYFKKKVRNFLTFKERVKIDWKEFSKCIEAGEDERQNAINEIKKYLSEMPEINIAKED